MKKFSVNIILICLLFFCFEDALAYTVSKNSISGVPYYTTAEDFTANLSGILDGDVVVKSVSGEFYTRVYKKNCVDESCLLKNGEDIYSINLNAPLCLSQLANGKGFNVTDIKNYNTNMAVRFTMETGGSFSAQSVTIKSAGKDALVFATETDGLISLKDVSGNKIKFARYSVNSKINAEIFLKRSGLIFSAEKVYINGKEFEWESPLTFNIGTSMSIVYRSVNTSEKLKNISALSVEGYRPMFGLSGLEASGEGSGVYYNYGTENINSVYSENGSEKDFKAEFGSKIFINGDTLIVKDLFNQRANETFQILSEKPTLGKIRLFKNGKEIYGLESGNITVKRDIADGNLMFISQYDKNGRLKAISADKEALHSCEADDIMKVFVFKNEETLSPVTLAAEITADGIFFNDGYEK